MLKGKGKRELFPAEERAQKRLAAARAKHPQVDDKPTRQQRRAMERKAAKGTMFRASDGSTRYRLVPK